MWCWDEVRIFCCQFFFLVYIWTSEKTAAVSLKSSFGTKEECFPLFHSVHHTHVALLVWAEGEVKLTSLPFLLSAYKKMNTTTLHLARVFTHSPPRRTTSQDTFQAAQWRMCLFVFGWRRKVCVEAADGINRGWTLRRHESCDWTFVDAARSLSRWVVELRTPIITCWYWIDHHLLKW